MPYSLGTRPMWRVMWFGMKQAAARIYQRRNPSCALPSAVGGMDELADQRQRTAPSPAAEARPQSVGSGCWPARYKGWGAP
jgi:hypothetical protein